MNRLVFSRRIGLMKMTQLIPILFAVGACATTESNLNRFPSQSPPLTCNVKDFGALANGQPDTEAIQKAVDACKDKGGQVYFPPGTYTSGTIRLGSNMTFHLDTGATLVGVRDSSAYPSQNPPTNNSQLLNCRRALLYAESTDNLVIEGPGVIDGSGDFKEWQDVKEAQRPMAIFAVQGSGLRIQNIQVKNAAMWAVVLMETEGSKVSSIEVSSLNGNTRDGIDIVDGSNVKIDHATVHSEDDSICLKSGMASGLQHVWVTNSQITGSSVANGLKFGTASTGVLKDIHFENINIAHVAQAAMALESVDGSQIDGVTFKNIQYSDTGTGIFMILGWRGTQTNPKVGSISNINFQEVTGVSSKESWGSALSGSEIQGVVYSPKNITFQNVQMKFKGNDQFSQGHLPPSPPEYQGQYPDPRMWPDLPSEGLYFRHVNNIVFKNLKLERIPGKDARPVLLPETGKSQFDAP